MVMFDLHDIFKDKPIDRKLFKKKIEVLEPGTDEWMQIWRANPELQSKMLEYAKKRYVWCKERQQKVAFVICYNKCEKGCFDEIKDTN
jgi:hypothetical protein